MIHRHTIPVSPPGASSRARSGITLLEVLVACGILVVGLASLASVLPAASSRLAEATIEDRVGVAAANAYADIINRGLASNAMFQMKTKPCVFGRGLDQIPSLSQGNTSPFQVADPTTLNARIDSTRGFLMEDDLAYTPSSTSDTPSNRFFNNNAGPREYREGICWGGLLVPVSGTASAGAEATLSVAVFRKAGAAQLLQLTQQSGSVFVYSTSGNGNNSSTGAADELTRKQFLPGCSYVLALPAVASVGPKWLRIMSSWTDAKGSFVSLDIETLGANYKQNYINGEQLSVVAFENLVRADQYTVTLE